jgi:dTDP-4-amino-4,6-dideoxygalactose transaminase
MPEVAVAHVARVLRRGALAGNNGYSKLVEKQLREICCVRHALFTTSCTHALELAMMVLNIREGDEVIMPSFTFVSSANAVVLRGARPVFAEIDPRTFNIDINDIKRRITSRTKALVPMHYAGVACEMDEILDIANKKRIRVVEDAAQGIDAQYRGRYLGTLGDIGCYSFHETKNIACGEGGAFLTNDAELLRRAEIIREKGTNRSAFLRGQTNKYTWLEAGSSYVQSDILATILSRQLSVKDEIRSRRKAIFNRYMDAFQPLEEEGLVRRPYLPSYASPNFHIFYLVVPSGKLRNHCLTALRGRGIQAAFHYVPLHSSPFGRKMFGYKTGDLPVTERLSRRLLRLPLYPDLTEDEQTFVIEQLGNILRDSRTVAGKRKRFQSGRGRTRTAVD